MIGPRKFHLSFAIAIALSLLPTTRDLSLAARWQQDGGFFGTSFEPRAPARDPSYRRQGRSNPFLSKPKRPRVSQPVLRKQRPAKKQRRQNQTEPPVVAVEVK